MFPAAYKNVDNPESDLVSMRYHELELMMIQACQRMYKKRFGEVELWNLTETHALLKLDCGEEIKHPRKLDSDAYTKRLLWGKINPNSYMEN